MPSSVATRKRLHACSLAAVSVDGKGLKRATKEGTGSGGAIIPVRFALE
jgi:hypothetical protein